MKKQLWISGFAALLLLAACSGNNPSGAAPEELIDGSPKPDGQALFVQNCASCHQPMRDGMGPMLKGALDRWGGDKTRLYAFIRNSSEMIAKGDARAVALAQKWQLGSMPGFPQFTDAEIEAILEYAD